MSPATTDTIAAPASGFGAAPRAIVRLSGPAVAPLLRSLCDPAPPDRRGVFAARLRIGADLRLPVLLLRSPAGRSFTGEDSAEILLPGNPHLVERLLALLLAHPGVRAATPGEFAARAYLNDRLTIDQAEGIAALIAAGSDAQLEGAARLMSGETGRRYRAWADELATLLALVEAGIDFTDQDDVVPIEPAQLQRRLGALAAELASALGASRGQEEIRSAPVVALAGRPSAGKSTLFNALLGRRRAVVSPVEGTTRDVLCEDLDLAAAIPGGPVVTLLDAAGLHPALPNPGATEVDGRAQHHAAAAINSADVVLHCDPTGRFADEGTWRPGPAAAVIRVRTKADLPAAHSSDPGSALAVCALDGFNLAALRRAIADAAWGSRSAGSAAAAVLPRHRRALSEAADRIEEAARLSAPELVAGSLRAALDSLGELTGKVSPDDVIGRIFATFCVGK